MNTQDSGKTSSLSLPASRRMSGGTPWAHAAGGSLALALLLLSPAGCKKKEPFVMPTPEVFVAPATTQDVPVMMELVGQTAGSEDVEIRARVEGILETVDFKEGDFVKKGALLYTIDPKPLEAIAAQAKANVATMEAKLSQAELDVARLKPLAEQEAVSRRDYDNAVSTRDAARGQLDAAKSALRTAELNLGYTRITSPISGLADLTKVRPGTLVGRGESTLLTTVSVIDPIYFDASITEADYFTFAARRQKAPPEEGKRTVDLILADGRVYPERGRLDAVQRSIDPQTGTLAVRLLFPNPQNVLRPGQYGRIRFTVETLEGVVCVPQKAVQEVQGEYRVAVIGAQNKAEFRKVKAGPRTGELWSILRGLEAGENVVIEGLQKVKEGEEVAPKVAGQAASPAAEGAVPAPPDAGK